ncbi:MULTISPECIES: VOC family protein [unclassified Streptomyces]|uniref:VOC family protein n=1 Tax=unclassified Streptomyces TaxID=2593676 RepID=UPI0022B751BF|nr:MULTISPECIES: VOC family protein [unclassified Streptomyces]MCZ7414620.1 VOC family protein [Streptomyces sp. WMMC897]MCZ7431549.1 VOC family protein [Streptomyces sp. WMMC1477]
MAIAEFGVTAIDCPDPRALAAFYSAVLGWETDPESDDEWLEIVGPDGRRLAFQRSEGYQPPRWPSTEHGQQMHLDFDVPRERLEEAERAVLELGATLLEGDDGGKRNWRVYADPVGHPFCLCAQ